ncbi:MAG: type II secretion system protein [Alteromonadales bacterium]|nr:type II secretion system protein [Alteromonadales bacterium]
MNTNKVYKLPMGKSQTLSRKNEQGFTLVTVLILSSLAGILVLNSLKDNVNQERLSGNFQKDINSRLASEQGINALIDLANNVLDNNQNATIADIIALGAQNGGINLGRQADHATLDHGGVTYNVKLEQDGSDELVLTSTGSRFEGRKVIKARFKFTSGGGGSPFANAVVGCDGVSIAGGGKISSYDSSNPKFTGGSGDVSTINPNADVSLIGGDSTDSILIDGDINSTGNIDLQDMKVSGNIHASGNVTMSSNKTMFERVAGYVWAVGDFTIIDGQIGGNVRVNGNATITGSTINNTPPDDLDIKYGKDLIIPHWTTSEYSASKYNVDPKVKKVPEHDVAAAADPSSDWDHNNAATNCDPLDITSEINNVSSVSGASYVLGTESTSTFTFNEKTNEYKYTANGDGRVFTTFDAVVLGETLPVIKLTSLSLTGDSAHARIVGDVTLYLTGDFVITNDSLMTIESGSSLTIITEGKVTIAGGGGLLSGKQGFTDGSNGRAARPSLSIYSSYTDTDTNQGILLDGAAELYGAIYAPLTEVKVGSGATIFGAVRGKKVTVDGGGKVSHDNVLSSHDRGGNSSTGGSQFKFLGLNY